jgi:hypothetical protein
MSALAPLLARNVNMRFYPAAMVSSMVRVIAKPETTATGWGA